MKKVMLILGLFLALNCFAQEKKLSEYDRLRASSQLYPFFTIQEGDVEYSLSYKDKGSMLPNKALEIDKNKPIEIIMKSTESAKFKTEDGFSVSSTFKDVKESGVLEGEAGHYALKIPSGWYAVWNTEEKPTDDSKIHSFFKIFLKL